MDIGVFLANLAKDPAFILIYALLVLSVGNFATGVFRAWQNGVFTLSAVGAWVKKDGGLVFPVVLYLGIGKALSIVATESIGLPKEISGLVFVGYAAVQGATAALSLAASIQENLSTKAQDATASKIAKAETIGDPVPDA